MAIRKASSYSKKIARPFTRTSRSKTKAYIKVVPHSKITKLTGGKPQDYNAGKYKFIIRLIANQGTQIRDNAIESCRMFLSNKLEKDLPGQYYMEIKIFPHHLLRENKSAGGMAGADRISTGMSHAYGVVIGRAAMVPAGKEILFFACETEKHARIIRGALDAAKAKLPCSTSIRFEKLA